jgi:hypothetical protein
VGRSNRWLVFAPVALFALFAQPAKADVLGEWTYSQSCATSGSVEVVDNTIILHGPDQNGCSGAAHWVKIETTIPADVDTIDFFWSYQTTDGWVYDPPQYGINGTYTLITQQNNATGTMSVPVNEGDIFTFRQYSIDTCCSPGHLTISNLSLWASITTSTTSTTTTTTTSTAPSTTVPVTNPTTTTVQETSTTTTTSVENSTSSSSVPTSTSLAPEPTMPEQSTTTTTTTTSLVVPTTTTTEPVSPPVAQPPVVVQPEPIELPTIEDMEPIPVVIEPVEEALPYETSETYPTVETPDTLPFVGVTEPDFVDDLPDFDLPVVDEPVMDIIPETLPDAPEAALSDEQVDSLVEEATTTEALVEALSELSDEQVEQVLEAILAEEPTQEQATALASSPEVLAIVSTEQATEIFEALNVTELDNTQLEALAAAVTNAPTEIKEAFEDSVDIFSDGLGSYVPVDSKIPVSERQTLIAIAAGATLTAASTRMKR